MKKFAALASVLVFAITIFAGQNFPLNTPFSGSVLSATFPKPDDSSVGSNGIESSPVTGTTDTDHATYSGTSYGSTTKGGKAWFGVDYVDYATQRGSGVVVLDKVVDGGIEGMKMVLVPDSRESTTFAGLFAREGEAVTDSMDTFVIAATVGNRLYMGVVVFDKSLHATKADADEFFRSVRSIATPLHDRT